MGRAPCCEKVGLRRGRWTAEEDQILINYIKKYGDGSWRSLPKNAGLLRCGKSCRLRWINYLRDDLKRGNFTREEEETIIKLHTSLGNKWSLIAGNLPGRTDNEVKNYWNTNLSRKIYSFRCINGALLNTIDRVKMASTAAEGKRKGGRVSRAVAKKYNKKNLEEKGNESGEPGDEISSLLEKLEVDLMDLDDISLDTEKNSMDDHRQETGSDHKEPDANETDDKGTKLHLTEDENENLYGCFSPINPYVKDLSWDSDCAAPEFTIWDEDDALVWPQESFLATNNVIN